MDVTAGGEGDGTVEAGFGMAEFGDTGTEHADLAVINTFSWRIARFEHGDEYTAWLATLYCHLECTVLGIPQRKPHPSLDLCRAWELLKRPYGQNAPQTLYDIARSGSEGGLRQIMRTMADVYGEEYARGLVAVAVGFYLAGRPPSDLISDAREYLALHREIIPSELQDGTPARIMASFSKVLEMHPFTLRRIRQSVR